MSKIEKTKELKLDESLLWKLRYYKSQMDLLELRLKELNFSFNETVKSIPIKEGEKIQGVDIDNGILILKYFEEVEPEPIQGNTLEKKEEDVKTIERPQKIRKES